MNPERNEKLIEKLVLLSNLEILTAFTFTVKFLTINLFIIYNSQL